MTSSDQKRLIAAAEQWLEENKGKRKPTINDVADLAGVSKKTVSRVINNAPRVKASTREQIQTIVEAINFQPDLQARGLASRHSFLVGLIYDNPNAHYVVNIQQGVLDGLNGTGYELVVHPCDRNQPDFVDEARRFIDRQKLRGVILTPSVSEDERMASMLQDIKCDYVRIASVKLDDDKHMLVSNDRTGGFLVAKHLCALGHSRIAFVAGKKGFRSSEERQEGFEEGLKEFGMKLDPKYIAQGEYTFESGIAAGHLLFSIEPRPTAIFAANDAMAAGIMQAMRIKGLRAPNDISIAGYDDFQIALTVWPRLTTVHSPVASIGRMSVEHLLAMNQSNQAAPVSTPWLVERESSGPPPE